jgi:hypothetical protein
LGNAGPDGSLVAEKAYINLVNLRGRVSNVKTLPDGQTFTLNDRLLGPLTVETQGATSAAAKDNRSLEPLSSRPLFVVEGQYAEVIGRKLGGSTVIAVTAYI